MEIEVFLSFLKLCLNRGVFFLILIYVILSKDCEWMVFLLEKIYDLF